MEEKISLDGELLKPIKDGLENTIKSLIKVSLTKGKVAELTLKVKIDATNERPDIEYTISEKIKEEKYAYKDYIHNPNCLLEIDEDGEIRINEIIEQEKLF